MNDFTVTIKYIGSDLTPGEHSEALLGNHWDDALAQVTVNLLPWQTEFEAANGAIEVTEITIKPGA